MVMVEHDGSVYIRVKDLSQLQRMAFELLAMAPIF